MEFTRGRALVIGISAYPNGSELPPAVLNDAKDIAALLVDPTKCGYEPAKVRVLLDDSATLENIRAALDELVRNSEPEDTVSIFFSGHGTLLSNPHGPSTALVPVDYDSVGFLQESEFSIALQSIKARRLVVMLDACHSGGAGSFKSLGPSGNALGYEEKTLTRLAQGVGRVLLASSRPTETSLVLGGDRNSIFTKHLLQALRGEGKKEGDGLIRVFDVFNHVSTTVALAAQPYGNQHPVFKASELENNFAIALDRGGVKATVAATTLSMQTASTVPDSISEQSDSFLAALKKHLPMLYPSGPNDQSIWERAGGDVSRLTLAGSGRAQWSLALNVLQKGGGGEHISATTLLEAAVDDFPNHRELAELGRLLG